MLFNVLPSEGGKAEQAVELSLLFPRNGDVPGLLLSLLLVGQTPGNSYCTPTALAKLGQKKKSYFSGILGAMTLWT